MQQIIEREELYHKKHTVNDYLKAENGFYNTV